MYPESRNLKDYLVADAIIDWQTPDVRQKALELTPSLSDEVDKARRIGSILHRRGVNPLRLCHDTPR